MLFKQVPRDNYVMLMAVFFMKAGQFMVMPFMALYLQHFPQATPSKIGLAIGLGPLAYGLFSPIGGWLVDRFGHRSATIWALLGSAINLYFFFSLHQWLYCYVMSCLLGMTRCVFDISSRTYRLHEHSLALRRFLFGLRFTVINSAAALGPFIGALAAQHNSLRLFKAIGIGYLLLSGWMKYGLKSDAARASGSTIDLTSMIHVLVRDRTLTLLISAAFLFWCVFTQIDSTLPQYLQVQLPHHALLYPSLLMTNAVLCAALQLMVIHYSRQANPHRLCHIGVALLFLAYLLIAVIGTTTTFVVYMVLLTSAELLLAPTQDYLVSMIAPPQYAGAYFGALGLAVLGMGIGPIVGGAVYQYTSGPMVFLMCAFLTLCIGFCYHRVFSHLPPKNHTG